MQFIKLNNGLQMPLVGLGLSVFPEDPITVENSVSLALPIGYRHFDTAFLYRTENHLGNALQKAYKEGVVSREDLFIVTKLPQIGMRDDLVEIFVKKSLENVQTSYIDLYLMHWPIGMEFHGEDVLWPMVNPETKECAYDMKTNLEAIWKGMEKQVKAGRVKSIGVSNFNEKQIERIMKMAEIPPANNQIELHAYLQQPGLRETCKKYGISLTAYFPIGGQSRNNYPKEWQLTQAVPLLEDPMVKEIAKKHGKTCAQILLRFLTQLDVCVIPKSSNPNRLKENFDILSFNLDKEDMTKMETLDKGEPARSCFGIPGCEKHPEYPFPSYQPPFSNN